MLTPTVLRRPPTCAMDEQECATFCALVKAGDFGAQAQALLGKLKQVISELDSLPPLAMDTPNARAEREMARSFLEAACVYALKNDDRDGFERFYLQLRPLHDADAKRDMGLGDSDMEDVLQGLYLMFLLVDNRIAEFHCELELLKSDRLAVPAVAFPVQMDQQLLVGNYDAIMDVARNPEMKLPHPLFGVFMAYITETVRENIALAAEAAYDALRIEDACNMLMLGDAKELADFAAEDHEEWIVEGGYVRFQPSKQPPTIDALPRMRIMQRAVGYATELERIV